MGDYWVSRPRKAAWLGVLELLVIVLGQVIADDAQGFVAGSGEGFGDVGAAGVAVAAAADEGGQG